MEVLTLIQKWRQGCQLAKKNPLDCPACTERLINDIELFETASKFNGCITPKFYLVVDELRMAVTEATHGHHDMVHVKASDVRALLNEFFRLDRVLRRMKPYVQINGADVNV